MERFSRYGILIARVMISMVFLLNALGVIDQTEAARELAARAAPSILVPFLMVVGTQSQPALIRSIYGRRTAGFLARKTSGSLGCDRFAF